MQDAVVNLIRVSLRDHQRFGHPPPRAGNQLGRSIPARHIPARRAAPTTTCSSTRSSKCGRPFTNAIGRPELAETRALRHRRRAGRTAPRSMPSSRRGRAQRSKHEVMRILGEAGVPCGACQDTGEVLADPHLKAREMIVDVDYPTRGTYRPSGARSNCPTRRPT